MEDSLKTVVSYDGNEVFEKKFKPIEFGKNQIESKLGKDLLEFFHLGDYFYVIFNSYTAKFEYCSMEIRKVLGYKPKEFSWSFFLNKIHPEDRSNYLENEQAVNHFFQNLPPEKVHKSKACSDFRVQLENGNYARLMQQTVAVQTEREDPMLRNLLLFTDITHLKTTIITDMSLSFVSLANDFQDALIPDIPKRTTALISRREKQVLQLLGQNKTSDQIALALFISKHTVDSHRKNLLRKTESMNTLQLVMKAKAETWI